MSKVIRDGAWKAVTTATLQAPYEGGMHAIESSGFQCGVVKIAKLAQREERQVNIGEPDLLRKDEEVTRIYREMGQRELSKVEQGGY